MDDLIMFTTHQVRRLDAINKPESAICPFDAQIGGEDQDAIGCRVQDGSNTLTVLLHLGVKLRVLNGDGCLVSEAGQQRRVVGGEGGKFAEDEYDPQHLLPGDQR